MCFGILVFLGVVGKSFRFELIDEVWFLDYSTYQDIFVSVPAKVHARKLKNRTAPIVLQKVYNTNSTTNRTTNRIYY